MSEKFKFSIRVKGKNNIKSNLLRLHRHLSRRFRTNDGRREYARLTQHFPFSFGLLGLLLLDPAFVSFVLIMHRNQQSMNFLKRLLFLFVATCSDPRV